MKDGLQQYEKMVNQVECENTINIPITGTVIGICANIPPFLSPYVNASGPLGVRTMGASWQPFLSAMGMSDFSSFPSTPVLTSQYVQSLSWGAMRQSAVQQSCKAASQAIATFEKKHPGVPIPPALLEASVNCAQTVAPVH